MSLPTDLRSVSIMASAQFQYLVDRFDAEARVAEGLCTLHPAQAAAWQPLIATARATVSRAAGTGNLDALQSAVNAAEAGLAPLAAVAKSYTIHCVGHAHIDMNWMWSWPETVSVTNDSFMTVLRLMEEFPDFKFSQSQASVYAIIERHHPAMLARIAERVREGRWEVTASHWVEGDKNIAGGESLCRHLLYTRQYMQQLFGLSPEEVTIDWSPDTFGHAATVPSYLVRGGVKYLYLHRPGLYTSRKLQLFWWQAPDGAKVLVRNDMRMGYNGQISSGFVDPFLDYCRDTGAQDYMFVYGVGDHGGGPTRRDLRTAVDMAGWPIFPAVRFSTAMAYYQKVEALGEALPTLSEELNTEFTGCYTTETLIKKSNRFAEARLQDAEIAAVLAARAAGYAYPTALFTEGWRDTLFSHFHDILPGSGVHDTRTYTHGLYQKTMAATGQIEMQALRALAAQVDTSAAAGGEPPVLPPNAHWNGLGAGPGYNSADGQFCQSDLLGAGNRPVLLFNPTAAPREEVITATLWDRATGVDPRKLWERPYRAIGPDGVAVAAQVAYGANYWGHDYAVIVFPASIPALGYARYIIAEGHDGVVPAAAAAWHISHNHHCTSAPIAGLENSLLRLEIDQTTGGIRSLVEKASGVEIIHDAPALEYAVEQPHGMSAWSIGSTGTKEYPLVREIRHTSEGPHKATLDVVLRIHESDFTITYELHANDPRLYLHIKGTWFQRGTRETGVPSLSLALPLQLSDAKGRYEIPFGAIDRTLNQGEEVPALQWAQVTGEANGQPAGCLLLNDTKHGHSLNGNTLRLTLIRSSYEPDNLPEIGQHEIHLVVQPFSGEMPIADATRAARELNQGIRIVNTDVHEGKLPAQAQFVTLAQDNLILSALKQAEDGEGLIIRVYETAGQATTANISICELLGAVASVQEVDLLERPVAKSHAGKQGNTVSVSVPALGIASVRVVFAN